MADLDAELMAELERARDQAVRARREGVLLVRRVARRGETPTSRIGGLPDLPDELSWPSSTATGLPLSFVAQIELSEVPRPSGIVFPARGRLFFFADFSEDHFEEERHVRVLFDPSAAPAASETPAPEHLPPFTPGGDGWGWLASDHPRAWVEPPSGLRFLLFDTFYDRPPPLEGPSRGWRDYFRWRRRREANDETLDVFRFFGPGVYSGMISTLRDEAVDRALGIRRGSGAFWSRRHSGFESPQWPPTSVEAEYALMAIAYRFRVKTLRDDHPCSPEQATALREALCERISDLRHGAPHELEPAERRAVRALVRDVRHACALIDHARRVNRETPLRQFLRWSRSELGSQVEGVYAHAAFEILRSMPDPAKFVPAELLHPDQEAMLGGRLYLHQMFGHASSPQDATSEYADHVLLLQIGGSPTLGLPLMGSAAMHYWITREDLARGRFDRVHGTWEAG